MMNLHTTQFGKVVMNPLVKSEKNNQLNKSKLIDFDAPNLGRSLFLQFFSKAFLLKGETLSGDSDQFFWLVFSTPLKNISQNGNFPQVGVKIKNIWNHHLVFTEQKRGSRGTSQVTK